MISTNYSRMPEEEVQQRIEHGKRHFQFRVEFYEIQWKEGRYFFHEHLQAARSWHEECIKEMLSRSGVQRVVGDQCVHGLKSWDGEGCGPAGKSTGFMTSSFCITAALSERCPNTRSIQVHDHVGLEQGRTRAPQGPPPPLNYARPFAEDSKTNRRRTGKGSYHLQN